MKYCLPCLALLLAELHPLPAEPPSFYQKRAQAALSVQVGQIGKDCPDAKNTIEENDCISKVEQQTKNDFAAFYGSLRALLKQDTEAIGLIDSSQEQWEDYAQKACEAIDRFYRGGTILVSAAATCRIQLTRSRMRDLDVLYFTTLHH